VETAFNMLLMAAELTKTGGNGIAIAGGKIALASVRYSRPEGRGAPRSETRREYFLSIELVQEAPPLGPLAQKKMGPRWLNRHARR